MKNRRKFFALIFSVILFVGMLPMTAHAADDDSDGYDDNDFAKLQAFLNLPSAVAGQTNGRRINGGYNPANPATWTGVVWNTDSPRRVVTIGLSSTWYNKSMAGPLDLSGFTALTRLECGANKITGLDLSGDTALTFVHCFINQLTTLDLSTNTALEEILCSNNHLASVNVNGAAALSYLGIAINELETLDISGAPALDNLDCGGNRLTSLDTGVAPTLTRLSCSTNLLTSLDVSANTNLVYLTVGGNPMASLDVSANTALEELVCYTGQLTSINVRGASALKKLTVARNSLAAIDVSTNAALTGLYLWDNQLTGLDVTHNPALEYLYCKRNMLADLDVRQNPALVYLFCNENQITQLDTSACGDLQILHCQDNRLATLDASHNTELFSLGCDGNPLTRIDAVINGGQISLSSNGRGYVELSYHFGAFNTFYISAHPHTGTAFAGWTSPIGFVSANKDYALSLGQSYELTGDFTYAVTFDKNGGDTDASPAAMAVISDTVIPAPPVPPAWANRVFTGWYREAACETKWDFDTDTVTEDMTLYARWVAVTGLPDAHTMYDGGRITWDPQPPGGTWEWDEEYFSASFNSPATFTALKAGTSTITYTADGVSQSVTVTIREAALPATGQNSTTVWVLGMLAVLCGGAALASFYRYRYEGRQNGRNQEERY